VFWLQYWLDFNDVLAGGGDDPLAEEFWALADEHDDPLTEEFWAPTDEHDDASGFTLDKMCFAPSSPDHDDVDDDDEMYDIPRSVPLTTPPPPLQSLLSMQPPPMDLPPPPPSPGLEPLFPERDRDLSPVRGAPVRCVRERSRSPVRRPAPAPVPMPVPTPAPTPTPAPSVDNLPGSSCVCPIIVDTEDDGDEKEESSVPSPIPPAVVTLFVFLFRRFAALREHAPYCLLSVKISCGAELCCEYTGPASKCWKLAAFGFAFGTVQTKRPCRRQYPRTSGKIRVLCRFFFCLGIDYHPFRPFLDCLLVCFILCWWWLCLVKSCMWGLSL